MGNGKILLRKEWETRAPNFVGVPLHHTLLVCHVMSMINVLYFVSEEQQRHHLKIMKQHVHDWDIVIFFKI